MGVVGWLCAWAVGGYAFDVLHRSRQAERAARAYCDSVDKPMLVVGAGTPNSSLRALILGPQRSGDVNLDLAGHAACPTPAELYASAPVTAGQTGPPVCKGNALDLSAYPDGFFGAILATHVLEHLSDPEVALAEWTRVADRAYVVTPQWWTLHAWSHSGHRFMFVGGQPYPLWGHQR